MTVAPPACPIGAPPPHQFQRNAPEATSSDETHCRCPPASADDAGEGADVGLPDVVDEAAELDDVTDEVVAVDVDEDDVVIASAGAAEVGDVDGRSVDDPHAASNATLAMAAPHRAPTSRPYCSGPDGPPGRHQRAPVRPSPRADHRLLPPTHSDTVACLLRCHPCGGTRQ
jgi:hypothetical protein